MRLASHAAIDQPRNQNVHLLLMLGLFALGQYRPAAMEAHAVASLGKLPDWPTVYAIYGNVDTYTRQLRALEKFSIKNPSAVEGRFLLGVQYAIDGHKGPAQIGVSRGLEGHTERHRGGQTADHAGWHRAGRHRPGPEGNETARDYQVRSRVKIS